MDCDRLLKYLPFPTSLICLIIGYLFKDTIPQCIRTNYWKWKWKWILPCEDKNQGLRHCKHRCMAFVPPDLEVISSLRISTVRSRRRIEKKRRVSQIWEQHETDSRSPLLGTAYVECYAIWHTQGKIWYCWLRYQANKEFYLVFQCTGKHWKFLARILPHSFNCCYTSPFLQVVGGYLFGFASSFLAFALDIATGKLMEQSFWAPGLIGRKVGHLSILNSLTSVCFRYRDEIRSLNVETGEWKVIRDNTLTTFEPLRF